MKNKQTTQIKTIDITQIVGDVLDKAGFNKANCSNESLNIQEAGMWDICDALSGSDNSKFSVEEASAEFKRRGL